MAVAVSFWSKFGSETDAATQNRAALTSSLLVGGRSAILGSGKPLVRLLQDEAPKEFRHSP